MQKRDCLVFCEAESELQKGTCLSSYIFFLKNRMTFYIFLRTFQIWWLRPEVSVPTCLGFQGSLCRYWAETWGKEQKVNSPSPVCHSPLQFLFKYFLKVFQPKSCVMSMRWRITSYSYSISFKQTLLEVVLQTYCLLLYISYFREGPKGPFHHPLSYDQTFLWQSTFKVL